MVSGCPYYSRCPFIGHHLTLVPQDLASYEIEHDKATKLMLKEVCVSEGKTLLRRGTVACRC